MPAASCPGTHPCHTGVIDACRCDVHHNPRALPCFPDCPVPQRLTAVLIAGADHAPAHVVNRPARAPCTSLRLICVIAVIFPGDLCALRDDTCVRPHNTAVFRHRTRVSSRDTDGARRSTRVRRHGTRVRPRRINALHRRIDGAPLGTPLPRENTPVPRNNTSVPRNSTPVPRENTPESAHATCVPPHDTSGACHHAPMPPLCTMAPCHQPIVRRHSIITDTSNTTVPTAQSYRLTMSGQYDMIQLSS